MIAAKPDPVVAELERRLGDSDDAYLVYADALQQRGDPRGELITLQHRRASSPHDSSLAKAETQLFANHPELLANIAGLATYTWRLGFIDHAAMYGRSAEELEHVVSHPSCRRLRGLDVGLEHREAVPAIEALAAGWSPHLRSLRIDQACDEDDDAVRYHDHDSADLVWTQLPELQTLSLRGFDLFSTIAHRRITELVIEDGMPFCYESKGPWRLPAVEKVAWQLATDNTGLGLDVDPEYLAWLWTAELPVLRHLDLSRANLAAWVMTPILDVAPFRALVRRLEVLWLGADALGQNADEVIEALTANQRDLSHLRELGVTLPRGATPEIAGELAALFPQFRLL